MDKVNQKMKKFNFRGVLDGLRSSVSAPPKLDIDIEENLRSEHFQVAKVGGCHCQNRCKQLVPMPHYYESLGCLACCLPCYVILLLSYSYITIR